MKKTELGNLISILEKEQKNIKRKNIISKNNNPSTKKISTSTKPNSKFNTQLFEKKLRQKLIQDYISYQNWDRPYISVGELLDCPRKVYYSRMKYDIDLEKEFRFSYLHIICEVGKKIHSIIQELYDFDEIEKTLISKKYQVKGRLDAVTNDTIFEIKTIDASKFTNSIVPAHHDQGSIYSWIMDKELNHKISNICIVYVFRDLRTIKTFDVIPDFDKAEKFLKRSNMIRQSIKSKKPPISKDKSKCTFCSYKKICYNDNNHSELDIINLL